MIRKVNYIKHIFYSLEDKIFSYRTLSTLVLLLICNFIFAIPLLNLAKDVGYDVNVTVLPMYLYDFEYDCTFIAIILYFFSGVPFLKYSEMYCIIREGKTNWVIKQIVHIVAMACVFMIMAVITSIVPFLIRGDVNNQWGKIAYTLSLTDKNVEYNCVKFPSSMLAKYSPWECLIVCVLFVTIIVIFMGMLVFAFSLVFNRVIAICLGAGFEINVQFEIDYGISYICISMFMAGYFFIRKKAFCNGVFFRNSINVAMCHRTNNSNGDF